MQINQITQIHKNKKAKVIGRGGRHAKTGGRGTKGQNARAGHKKRPEMRDILKKLPKQRGYRFASIVDKSVVVHLDMVAKYFNEGETVSRQSLVAKGLVKTVGGKIPPIKILARGEFSKKISFVGCLVSASATTKIVSAGGTVIK